MGNSQGIPGLDDKIDFIINQYEYNEEHYTYCSWIGRIVMGYPA